MDFLSKIEDLTKQLELEKESHKKTKRTFDKRLLGIKKHHDFCFKQNQDLKNQFVKVDKFIKKMISDGRITDKELSVFFTKKDVI